MKMHYSYIIHSSKLHRFYVGSTQDINKRLKQHNSSIVFATKSGVPWKIVWLGTFVSTKEANNFEQYLKTDSGRAFMYKRLVPEALAKDFFEGRIGSPKSQTKDT